MSGERGAARMAHKFTLEDFADGAVCGILCVEANRNQSLLEPVRQWIQAGKLRFAPGQSDILGDVLYLVETGKASAPAPPVHERAPRVRRAGEPNSWPYICGRDQRLSDDRDLDEWQRKGTVQGKARPQKPERTPNPCINLTGRKWQAGYDGQQEPEE